MLDWEYDSIESNNELYDLMTVEKDLPEDEPWRHGAITRDHAESLLVRYRDDNRVYLVRDKNPSQDVYVLSCRDREEFTHTMLEKSDGGFFMAGGEALPDARTLKDAVALTLLTFEPPIQAFVPRRKRAVTTQPPPPAGAGIAVEPARLYESFGED